MLSNHDFHMSPSHEIYRHDQFNMTRGQHFTRSTAKCIADRCRTIVLRKGTSVSVPRVICWWQNVKSSHGSCHWPRSIYLENMDQSEQALHTISNDVIDLYKTLKNTMATLSSAARELFVWYILSKFDNFRVYPPLYDHFIFSTDLHWSQEWSISAYKKRKSAEKRKFLIPDV